MKAFHKYSNGVYVYVCCNPKPIFENVPFTSIPQFVSPLSLLPPLSPPLSISPPIFINSFYVLLLSFVSVAILSLKPTLCLMNKDGSHKFQSPWKCRARKDLRGRGCCQNQQGMFRHAPEQRSFCFSAEHSCAKPPCCLTDIR